MNPACRNARQMRNLRGIVGKYESHQLSPFGNTDARNLLFIICSSKTREDDTNLKAPHLLLLPATSLQQL